jgi:hypothetical protein
VIAEQQSNGQILFREFDYATNVQQYSYLVSP